MLAELDVMEQNQTVNERLMSTAEIHNEDKKNSWKAIYSAGIYANILQIKMILAQKLRNDMHDKVIAIKPVLTLIRERL